MAPEARGLGHARRLYDDLAAVAAGRPLCCEVNVVPPNPASLAFHDRLGFVTCGEDVDPRNGKRVRYLVQPGATCNATSGSEDPIRDGR
jgi:predicted GNAT superfamily acetyltransferase